MTCLSASVRYSLTLLGFACGVLYAVYGVQYRVDPFWGDWRGIAMVINMVVFGIAGAVAGYVAYWSGAAAIGIWMLIQATAGEAATVPAGPPQSTSQRLVPIIAGPAVIAGLIFFMWDPLRLWRSLILFILIGSPPSTRSAPTVTPPTGPAAPAMAPTAAPAPAASKLSLPYPAGSEAYLKRAQAQLPDLLGTWYYPGAEVWPCNEPRPEIPFSAAILLTQDDLAKVIGYYRPRLTVIQESPERLLGRAARPGDGRNTFVNVRKRDSYVCIEFSTS